MPGIVKVASSPWLVRSWTLGHTLLLPLSQMGEICNCVLNMDLYAHRQCQSQPSSKTLVFVLAVELLQKSTTSQYIENNLPICHGVPSPNGHIYNIVFRSPPARKHHGRGGRKLIRVKGPRHLVGDSVFQNYCCLSKTSTMTTPVDIPRGTGKTSQGPTPRCKPTSN